MQEYICLGINRAFLDLPVQRLTEMRKFRSCTKSIKYSEIRKNFRTNHISKRRDNFAKCCQTLINHGTFFESSTLGTCAIGSL